MRIKSDLLRKKESIRAWEGGERGEGVRQRCRELSAGQRADRRRNSRENAQPPRAAKYPGLQGADRGTTPTLILGPLVGVKARGRFTA